MFFYKIPLLPRLRKLEAANNLFESIPVPFESLSLDSLNLSENRISKLAANCFKSLTNLKVLDLRQNRITAIDHFPIESKLETIIISNNRLTKIQGIHVGTVPELKILDLKDNKISDFDDEFFTLEKIHTLDITNNEFNRLQPEIGLMAALKKFFIVGNPLKTIRSDVKSGGTEKLKKYLADMIDVSKINAQTGSAKVNLAKKELTITEAKSNFEMTIKTNLNNNTVNLINLKISDIGKEILLFEHLQGVNLSKNALAQFPVILSSLRNLRFLNLNENLIERVQTYELTEFNNLETMDLQSNRIVSFCDDFSNYESTPILRNLRSIDIGKNKLTQASFLLANLPKLDSLCLSYNNLTNIDSLTCLENNCLDSLVLSNNKIEQISNEIENLFKLSVFAIENNNIKNFPPEIGHLNLKSFSILGNPSIMSTEKMSGKGTVYLLSHLKNKIPEDKFAKYEQKKKNFKPKQIQEIQKQTNLNENVKKEPVQSIETTKNQTYEDEAKSKPVDSKESPQKVGQGFGNHQSQNDPKPTGISNQQIHFQKKVEADSQASQTNVSVNKPQNEKAEPSSSQKESFLGIESYQSKGDSKKLSAEHIEMTKRVSELQSFLDNDYNLNTNKKLAIRKELNSLRAKLNQ